MIEVQQLTKRYGSVTAVNQLSFSVKPGIVTGFLGPNGAGKSTTMRMILGLDEPTSGSATIDGKKYSQLKHPAQTVGALLDAKWIHPKRSARKHLEWMAVGSGIPTSRVDEVLELVGLSEVAKKKAGGFSLGMSQRLGLAGALLGDPEYLILDEPVNGLDPEGIRWVRTFLKNLAAEGRSVLVSSHMLSEMALTADHLIVIGKGELKADTSVDAFVNSTGGSHTFLRVEHVTELRAALESENYQFRQERDDQGRELFIFDDMPSDEIGKFAYSCGIPVLELSHQRKSLEDAFMSMTADSVQYATGTTAPSVQSAPTRVEEAK